MPEDEARAYIARQDQGEAKEPDEFWVLPENWDTVMLFLRLQTQWRVAGMGGLMGLDYTAVISVMGICKHIKDQEHELDRIRLMEAAALETMDAESHAD